MDRFLDDYRIENDKIVAILSDKTEVAIPRADIDKMRMNVLDALDVWLCDNEYITNDDQTAFIEATKDYKVKHECKADKPTKERKPKKDNTTEAKKQMFKNIIEMLQSTKCSFEVVKSNKLVVVQYGGYEFKIDLIQTRNKGKV